MSHAVDQPIRGNRPSNIGCGPAQDAHPRPRQGIALCLSGGGYRAAIFHAGALLRLNELGVLTKVDTVCCVSGGSIIGGFFAFLLQNGLERNENRYISFEERLQPFFTFVRRDIRTLSTLARLKLWEAPG